MNTPTDNAWLDKWLEDTWNGCEDYGYATGNGKDKFAEAKAAILTHIDTVCREAYKKGYIDKGIEELTK